MALSKTDQANVRKATKHINSGRLVGPAQVLLDRTATGLRLRYGSVGGRDRHIARGLSKKDAEGVISSLRKNVKKSELGKIVRLKNT